MGDKGRCDKCNKQVVLRKGRCVLCGDMVESYNVRAVSEPTGKAGNLAGVLACVCGVLAIFTFGIVFVPLAVIFAVAGLIQSIVARNGGGVAISLLGLVIAGTGFASSPSLWLIAGTATQAHSEYTAKTEQKNTADMTEQLIPGVVDAFTVGGGDFRGFSWGDSLAYVKKHEIATFDTGNEAYLRYKGLLSGLSVEITYEFIDGKLFSGAYRNAETYFNKNKFIDDYDKINVLLDKKYGAPASRGIYWSNDLYKGDSENYGVAIAMGQVVYASKWDIGNTQLLSGITGDNLKVGHIVIYSDKRSLDKHNENPELKSLELL